MNLLTIPEVAKRLRCHDDTVRRLINEGDLPAFKVGRYLVDENDLESWLQKQKPQPPRPSRAARNVRQLPEKRATRIERLKSMETMGRKTNWLLPVNLGPRNQYVERDGDDAA